MSGDDEPLDAIVVELYACSPAEFTAARTERAKKEGGALGRRVAKIRKPVVSAWVVDLLAREGHLADALELGGALREAQESLDAGELARLGRQRRQLVAALAQTGAELAGTRGVAVSAAARDDVAATLNAALIDADAAAAVATARLAKPLEAGGAGDVDLGDALSGSAPAAVAAAAAPDDELAERRARRAAEQEAREAERAAERADREQADTAARRDRAQERVDRLRDRVEALRRDLDRAEADAESAEAELTELEQTATEAVAVARAASQRARAARERVD